MPMNDTEYRRIREALRVSPIEQVAEEFGWPRVDSVLLRMMRERESEIGQGDPGTGSLQAAGALLPPDTLAALEEALELYKESARQALERAGVTPDVREVQENFAFLTGDLLRRPQVAGTNRLSYPRPSIAGFEPAVWTRGEQAAIVGTTFGRVTGVEVGGAAAEELLVAPERIELAVPDDARDGSVRLLPSGIVPGPEIEQPPLGNGGGNGRR
jgi:hypothetical protein